MMIRTWLISVAGMIGFLIGAYLLITYGLPLVLPFVIALLLAEFIDPVVAWLAAKARLPRSLAVTLVLLVFVGVITTAMTVAVARLIQEVAGVIDSIPYLYAIAVDLGNRFAEQFGAFHSALPAAVQRVLAESLTGLESSLQQLQPLLKRTLGSLGSLPAQLMNLLIALVATFFISRDKSLISGFLLSLFPSPWRPKLQKVKADVWASAIGWAKAQTLLILLTMIQTMIGLSVIGSNYAVLMGIVVGVADMLPLLGPATILLPWVAYSFVFGNALFGLKLLILWALIAGIRQALEAKLVGDQIGLHPLAILLAIYLGFHFFGALGFVVGPLLAILLKALIKSELLPDFED